MSLYCAQQNEQEAPVISIVIPLQSNTSANTIAFQGTIDSTRVTRGVQDMSPSVTTAPRFPYYASIFATRIKVRSHGAICSARESSFIHVFL